MAESDQDILLEARERFRVAADSESHDRVLAEEDIRFEAGDQWPDVLRRAREDDPDGGRPCLTVNMVRKHKNNLLNGMRKARPSIKVLPVDDIADPETAKVLNGLLRHIQVTSDASVAYDNAADGQVVSGIGYFRILPKIIDDDTGEQELTIGQIRDRFSVYMDPLAQHPAGADQRYCFIVEDMSKDDFEQDFPKREEVDWAEAGSGDDRHRWYPNDETVRVAEYFRLVEERATVVLVETGDEYEQDQFIKSFPEGSQAPQVVATRLKTFTRCEWFKLSGDAVLERTVMPTQYVPVLRVSGEERFYNSQREFRGIVRDMIDPQSMYNFTVSANVEHLALQPRAPWTGPAEAFENYEAEWQEANRKPKAFLPYNQMADDGTTRLDRPERASPIGQNTGLVTSMMQFAEDLRQVSGQSQASFGEQSNEQSGRAINARRSEQDDNTFHFMDNLSLAIKHAGRILLDMIPRVYDTKRVVRILGEDESPDFATFDPQAPRAMVEREDVTGGKTRIYNPGLGRYDVVVTIGASYATRAEEGAQRLSDIVQARPDLMPIVGDLLFKNMDVPGADELSERMKAMMPPELKALGDARDQGGDAVRAQVEQMQQEMQAQMEPLLQQLQEALQQAGQENEQLTQELEAAQMSLNNKEGEMALKARELEQKDQASQRDYEAKMQDAEAEVAVALVNAQAAPQDEPREREDESGESAGMASVLAVLQEMMAGSGASAGDSVLMAQQLGALQERMDATAEDRERMLELAQGLLMGSVTEEQVAGELAARH